MESARLHRDETSPLLRQVFVVSGAALNIAGHGCIHGFPAVLFAQLRPGEGGQFIITDVDASWIASVLGIMGIIGNFLSPVLMNRYGRQKTHLLSTIPALLGWIAVIFTANIPTILVARLLHGLALGIRTPLAAILVAEYTNPKYRGALLGTFAISLGLGILLTHLVGAYLTWKMTALVSSVFPMAAMLVIALSPESPSWLAAKGHFDKCETVFRWLRGRSVEQEKELQIMIATQTIEIISSQKTNMKRNYKETFFYSISVFGKREFFKPAIIAICMFVIFEFGGAHIVPAYANRILREILGKNPSDDVQWQITTVDFLRMLSAFLAMFLLNKFDRRTILFTSGTMTVLSFVFISSYMYARKFDMIPFSSLDSFLPMALIVLYSLSFYLGLVPLTWVVCGEIFPLSHRSLGSTFSTACLTPAFILSMKTAPHLFNSVGVEGAYLVYTAILTVCLIIIFCLLPETRGRTLQEIEDSFKGTPLKITQKEVEMTLMLNS